VEALAQEYGFKHLFLWQPTISIGSKQFTREEENIKYEVATDLIELIDSVYPKIQMAALEKENLYYIAHVFDKEESQI